jgi:phytanoyl-CoA hydroxylase
MNQPDMTEITADMSAAQDAFEHDGYVVARALCPPARLQQMGLAVERDLAAALAPVEYEAEVAYPGAPDGRDAPGGDTVRRLLDALGRDPAFADWACCRAMTAWVRALLRAREIRVVRAHHNCIMTKHPDYSSATGWHQDIRYWSFDRPELVNAWTALDREACDNGGMRLIPGSHRAAFDARAFDSERFFRDDYAANRAWTASAIQVDLQPGDVLFFHAGLLHAAGRNLTDRRKRAVVFSYRAESNRPQPDRRSAAADDLDPERGTCD